MKISDEFLGLLGAIFLLILVIFLQGLLFYGIINGICWIFNIKFHIGIAKAMVLGVLLSVLLYPYRKKD